MSGDAAGNPFNILTAMNQTYLYAKKLWNTSHRVIGAAAQYTPSVVIVAVTQVSEVTTPCPGVFSAPPGTSLAAPWLWSTWTPTLTPWTSTRGAA